MYMIGMSEADRPPPLLLVAPPGTFEAEDLRTALRAVYSLPPRELIARGRRARELVCANLTWAQAYHTARSRIAELVLGSHR